MVRRISPSTVAGALTWYSEWKVAKNRIIAAAAVVTSFRTKCSAPNSRRAGAQRDVEGDGGQPAFGLVQLAEDGADQGGDGLRQVDGVLVDRIVALDCQGAGDAAVGGQRHGQDVRPAALGRQPGMGGAARQGFVVRAGGRPAKRPDRRLPPWRRRGRRSCRHACRHRRRGTGRRRGWRGVSASRW